MTQMHQFPQLTLLERIVAALRADTRVRAAVLRGPFYTGRPDTYSNLDLLVVLEPSAVEAFCRQARMTLTAPGSLLWLSTVAADPPHLRALFAGPIQVDLFVATPATLPPYHGWRVLFDHDGLLKSHMRLATADDRLRPEHVTALCDTFWWTIFASVGQLKRGHLWMALHALDVCRADLARVMRWRRDPQPPTEHFAGLEQYLTAEDQQALAQTLASHDLRSIATALLCAADAFDPAAREAAGRVGAGYPADLAQAVKQFFIREFWVLIAPGPTISA